MTRLPLSTHGAELALASLASFGALSALVGAVLAIGANGGGVPLDYLTGSPFSSYLIPGLLLGLAVGGTQLAAVVAVRSGNRAALGLSAVAGFGMLIWVFAELAVLRQYSWLQTVYFGLGVAELMLVLGLLGVSPALVVPGRAADPTLGVPRPFDRFP